MVKYQVIYADPPWRYKESWGNGSNEHTYPTMTVEEIKALDIPSITKSPAHLYLWVTNPFIKEGLEICEAWGFDYKTLLTWVKTYQSGKREMGMGYYFRSCTEHIIFGTRGKMRTISKNIPNLVEYPNPRNHSAKPGYFRDMIVKASGDLPRVELFAREKTPGWASWGNEVESDVALSQPKESK